MNKLCKYCGVTAVYWHSIKKVVMCQKCMRQAEGKDAELPVLRGVRHK